MIARKEALCPADPVVDAVHPDSGGFRNEPNNEAKLSEAGMAGANQAHASLSEAILADSKLADANHADASLADAELSYMDLSPEWRGDLLDPEGWDKVLERFAVTSKMAVALVDRDGRLLGKCHNPQPAWRRAQ
jgi:hypothetical protein